MQSNHQYTINTALEELSVEKTISSALSVCNALLEYMGLTTRNVEDIVLSKLKLPNAERYDRWFDQHPHFRGDRACFDLTSKDSSLEAKFYALQKRSKLFIAGAVNFTPNFEDHEYTRNDPSMRIGIDFFLTPEKESLIVVLSNKGGLRLVELSEKLTHTQVEIFTLWDNIAKTEDKNTLHTTIWESFKLSSLNKKFYEGIANSFTSLVQHLRDSGIEEQLANQFSNRLHGRLLFLWFLRKKNIINESKEYFTIGNEGDTKYYQNTLGTLFFGVLNNEHHKNIDPITPYLNGGLFDQKSDGDYWNTHKPTFPTGFFKTLYDHFYSFNFTTDESTPEYEQIAIDPEMLGRIFESFLATLKTETGAQAKKAHGAFYTPREIVSYMSRESLRQYLYTTLKAGATLKGSIDELLDRSDSEWALAGTNSKRDTVAKEDRERIMNALREVKVLDPAAGSGAFPMGILHKILSLFERIDPSFDAYETKLSILKNNIYGVDIDPTAIEISRLRAWLSIIVDVKDIKKIKPLPNLDFKFVCANSLMSLDSTDGEIFKEIEGRVINELSVLFENYYNESKRVAKEKLRKEIEFILQHSKVFLQAGSSFKEKLDTYKPFNTNNVAQFYNPKLMHGVTSFNVIIGNPPYGAKFTKQQKDFYKVEYSDVHMRTQDSLNYFISRSLRILSKNGDGLLSLIVSNNLLFQSEYKKTRELFLKKNKVLKVINLGDQVFESAIIPSCIFLLENKVEEDYEFKFADLRLYKNNLGHIDFNSLLKTYTKKDILETPAYVFGVDKSSINIIKKIESLSLKIDDIAEEVASGISSGGDKIFRVSKDIIQDFSLEKDLLRKVLIGREMYDYKIDKSSHSIIYTTRETELDKYPNTKNYLLKFKEKLSLRSESKAGILPWFALNRQRYPKLFEDKKIIFRQTSDSIRAAYDESGYYALDTILILKLKKDCGFDYRFILGILNSKLTNFIYKEISQEGGRVFAQVKPINIRKLYVPNIRLHEQNDLIKVVDQILIAKNSDEKNDTKNLENQIDSLVYKLYDLNKEEVKIIDKK